jgi:transposase
MSLHPHVLAPVPEETVRVARAAFPKGNPSLALRDALGSIFQDEDFAAVFPMNGQPGLPPWRLALVTIMQRIFPAHFEERRIISEGYWNSCPIM